MKRKDEQDLQFTSTVKSSLSKIFSHERKAFRYFKEEEAYKKRQLDKNKAKFEKTVTNK